jgi:3-hydroxyisobutyrate dehydrogenase
VIGFAGLGLMGRPMALNLLRAGAELIVWNRTAIHAEALVAHGATVARDVAELFARADPVLLMVSDGQAVDELLGRGTAGFAELVGGRTLVLMSTVAAGTSRRRSPAPGCPPRPASWS